MVWAEDFRRRRRADTAVGDDVDEVMDPDNTEFCTLNITSIHAEYTEYSR
jgi:hypothetical protein